MNFRVPDRVIFDDGTHGNGGDNGSVYTVNLRVPGQVR